ncbi:MAG: hypothetical protein WHX52_08520 [Anaerolineae bacterium]
MSWTAEQQELFDALRARELSGILTPTEQDQLKALYAWLEAEEALYLSPTIAQMKADQAVLREKLESAHTENEALGRLLNQQEKLVADARRWLAQFEKRHRRIQQAYARLTGEALTGARP